MDIKEIAKVMNKAVRVEMAIRATIERIKENADNPNVDKAEIIKWVCQMEYMMNDAVQDR